MTAIHPKLGTPTTESRTAVDALTRALEVAGIYVAVELRDGTLSLSGEVATRQERDAVLDIAETVASAHGLAIDDGLELIPSFPDSAFADGGSADHGAFGYLAADRDHDLRLDLGLEDEPDFAGEVGTTDAEEATAEAIPYFPATDPVVSPAGDDQRLAVVGGFGATSLDTEPGDEGRGRRNDDEIADDVRRVLNGDALTADLQVEVEVRHGIVYLRGSVQTFDDAENAEAVTGRVRGVREVREEFVIASLH